MGRESTQRMAGSNGDSYFILQILHNFFGRLTGRHTCKRSADQPIGRGYITGADRIDKFGKSIFQICFTVRDALMEQCVDRDDADPLANIVALIICDAVLRKALRPFAAYRVPGPVNIPCNECFLFLQHGSRNTAVLLQAVQTQ